MNYPDSLPVLTDSQLKDIGLGGLVHSPLNQAMMMLAKHPKTLFIGQGVAYDGVSMFRDLDGVPMDQRIEFPVAEELQMGASIGLAMQGFLPISIFPRMDFLLRAMDALVNHLDKIPVMSMGQWVPKVIIRTRVGSKSPLDAGPQHTQNHTVAMQLMLKNIWVVEITKREEIRCVYEQALRRQNSTLVVESLPCY